jgi:hypothetical protein
MIRWRRLCLWCVFAVASLAGAQTVPPSALLPNADLTRDADGDGWPDGWPRGDGISFARDGDQPYLRLVPPKPGVMVMLYRQVTLGAPLPPALEIRLRLRHTDVKPGEKPWFDARVIAHFKNAKGKTLKPEPATPTWKGSSNGWLEHSYVVRVPVSAHLFEFMPCLFQAAAGSLDIARCEVLTATAEQLRGKALVASETVVPPTTPPPPPALRVVGNKLQTVLGNDVWLQGLCIDSLEWSAGGERIAQSVPVAVEQWRSNVVRLPVRDDFWFGRGPWQGKDGGLAYRKIVDAAVEAVASRGAYLALDLHRFGSAREDHVDFWRDAATRYKNHPAVLFELFNEPHGTTWKLWRDGGNLHESGKPDELTGEVCVGLQALLDAVRATGARNPVIVGGLDWGYDLSGVVGEWALTERPGGQGIVYSSHIYPWKTDWQNKVLAAAARYPLFIGEVGCPPDYKGFEFIPPAGRHPLEGWAQDVIALIQRHRLHWTGFSFHPKCGPMVISDWNYTPTPYWGVFVKEALLGKAFELKKLR